YVLNCHAPDEGNMHTLLHHADAEQKERYLRPLVDGRVRSCFAMTEPEVAGSDPTGIRTTAVRDGDHWVLNGHKWFIPGARGAARPGSRTACAGSGAPRRRSRCSSAARSSASCTAACSPTSSSSRR